MIPFVAMMSVAVALTTLTITRAVGGVDLERAAVHDLRPIRASPPPRRHLSRDHVVGENGDELILVLRLEQGLDRAFRQLREGLIRGREDGCPASQ